MNIEQETRDFREKRYKEECHKALEQIPSKYREKVLNYAYEQGHSSGWSEVYNYVLDLIDIFKV